MRERFQKHDNDFSRASLCLVQCTSWCIYNGDNTCSLLSTTFYYVTQIYRKVAKLNIHGIIVKYDRGDETFRGFSNYLNVFLSLSG